MASIELLHDDISWFYKQVPLGVRGGPFESERLHAAIDELDTLRTIIAAFADRVPVYETDMGNLYCIYCDDYREYDAVQEKELERLACHEPTCPWRLAVEYVERGKLKE